MMVMVAIPPTLVSPVCIVCGSKELLGCVDGANEGAHCHRQCQRVGHGEGGGEEVRSQAKISIGNIRLTLYGVIFYGDVRTMFSVIVRDSEWRERLETDIMHEASQTTGTTGKTERRAKSKHLDVDDVSKDEKNDHRDRQRRGSFLN